MPSEASNRLRVGRAFREAARVVAESSGLPQEVVYLYNGPGGTAFDSTLKPSLVDALKNDVPYNPLHDAGYPSIGATVDVLLFAFLQRFIVSGLTPSSRWTPPSLRRT